MIETNYQYAEGHLRILKKLEKQFEKLHEKLADLRKKLKENNSKLNEKWVEYNFNFGEDKKEAKK